MNDETLQESVAAQICKCIEWCGDRSQQPNFLNYFGALVTYLGLVTPVALLSIYITYKVFISSLKVLKLIL